MGDAANHALGVDDESLPTPDVIHCQEEDEMVASDAPSSDEVSLSNTQSKGESIAPHVLAQDVDDESATNKAEVQNTEDTAPSSCDPSPNAEVLEMSQQSDQSIVEANQSLDGASLAEAKRAEDESDTFSKEVATDNNSFLANARVEDVVLPGDCDASFLEGAQIEVPNVDPYDDCNSHSDDDTRDDSYFNMYASNMSRGTASIVSYAAGDEMLRNSNLASKLGGEQNTQTKAKARLASDAGDDSTLGTYDYQRAYVDLAVNSTTCSALTDDYAMADRGKLGMDDDFMTSRTQRLLDPDQSSTDPMERGFPPLSETHAVPGVLPTNPNSPAFIANQEHLGIMSFGEGKGYIDEEAAQIYNPPSYGRAKGGCCVWFRSSPRSVKMIVIASLVLMVVGIASLSAAVMIPRVRGDSNVNSNSDVNAASSNSRFDGLPEKKLGIIRQTLAPSERESDMPTYSPSTETDKPTEVPTKDLSTSNGFPLSSSDRDFETEFSSQPTTESFASPTIIPTGQPTTSYPTESQNLASPTTAAPTLKETRQPITQSPSRMPTAKPSQYPTSKPSRKPVFAALPPVSSKPTVRPSPRPTTSQPSKSPVTDTPTGSPSFYPTYMVTTSAPVTDAPTKRPTKYPVTSTPFFPTRWPTRPPTKLVRFYLFRCPCLFVSIQFINDLVSPHEDPPRSNQRLLHLRSSHRDGLLDFPHDQ